ncbi:hypothetical protein LDENG_00040030 [Lucifuga dentata]|nr:hypothetical protein LDENG_00040030 [Lucifuga dentata]
MNTIALTDINVVCGTQSVELQILLCPIYYNGYNESQVALNSEHTRDQCFGIADWTVIPPVIKFNFSLTEDAIAACACKLAIIHQVGTGVFSAFSVVQYINISGMVCTHDSSAGVITYHQETMYMFSCLYPLQYLVQNMSMSVSASNVAIKDGNGSFISTLRMQLYEDSTYTTALHIPSGGLELKTRIFVEVKATNLSASLNVLLDRCFTTISPSPDNSTYHDLFVGCNRDDQTVIKVNGEQKLARFSFEAFRFIVHANSLSTFYLHCATRLCEPSFCSTVTQDCAAATTTSSRRRRRGASNSPGPEVSEVATISSGPIVVHEGNEEESESSQTGRNSTRDVEIIAGVIGAFCIVLIAFIAYQMYKSGSSLKTVFGSPK